MSRTTITGVKGMPLPNLEAHGLARKMKRARSSDNRLWWWECGPGNSRRVVMPSPCSHHYVSWG
jgi:hypothetical protein